MTLSRLLIGFVIACGAAPASMVLRLNLDELVGESEMIVHGRVLRSWSAWDSAHRFIWTHHELSVQDLLKGRTGTRVIVSEPGGTVDGISLQVSGAVRFADGEEDIVFLYRTPIGYLRTCGSGQGKYTVMRGIVHTDLADLTLVDRKGMRSARGMEGAGIAEFKAHVRRLVR